MRFYTFMQTMQKIFKKEIKNLYIRVKKGLTIVKMGCIIGV
jgi:preprotein translocase subunit YajC